jgi:hypothetical protein
MLSLLVSQALAAPPGFAIVPFGVGVYLHDRPVRGGVYTATQAAGLGVLTWATVAGYQAAQAEDDEAFYRWQSVGAVGVSAFAASYLVSILDAGRLHEIETGDTEKRRVMLWDEARYAGMGIR